MENLHFFTSRNNNIDSDFSVKTADLNNSKINNSVLIEYSSKFKDIIWNALVKKFEGKKENPEKNQNNNILESSIILENLNII